MSHKYQSSAAPAVVIQSGIHRVWTCDQCGVKGEWNQNWSTWGSLHEDEHGRRLVVCSDKCRSSSDPSALWVKKYGETPRKFRVYAGGYLTRPTRRAA